MAYINAANILQKAHFADEAQLFATLATTSVTHPKGVSFMTLGNVLAGKGELERAIAEYENNLRLQPNFLLTKQLIMQIRWGSVGSWVFSCRAFSSHLTPPLPPAFFLQLRSKVLADSECACAAVTGSRVDDAGRADAPSHRAASPCAGGSAAA